MKVERIPVSVVIMSQNGEEHRYDRYARSTSIMDTMLAEDSAVRAFTVAFGEDPISIRRVSSSLDGGGNGSTDLAFPLDRPRKVGRQ